MNKLNDRNQLGFTLIELLLVITVISIIAAMSVPSLLRSRMSANESVGIACCKTLVAAETDYNINSRPQTYTGSFACLGSGGGAGDVAFIDATVSGGVKAGYTFTLISGAQYNAFSYYAWSAAGRPISYKNTGVRSFYVDSSGIIRGSDIAGQFGTLEMPPYDK
jgi:type IV pilus assembly protein PilA